MRTGDAAGREQENGFKSTAVGFRTGVGLKLQQLLLLVLPFIQLPLPTDGCDSDARLSLFSC